jgi:hypothetical protein
LRPARVTSTRVVYENRWMRVHEDRLEREDGSPGLYGWIEAEETGLRAASVECLGRLYFAYGISNQPVDVWRASGLEPGPRALESSEAGLVVARFSVAEVEEMVRSNVIQDAASVAAWHLCSK